MVPSRSVSFAVISSVTGVSSAVVVALFAATGASFTGVTVMFTVATFEVAPLLSFTVYVIEAGPL